MLAGKYGNTRYLMYLLLVDYPGLDQEILILTSVWPHKFKKKTFTNPWVRYLRNES